MHYPTLTFARGSLNLARSFRRASSRRRRLSAPTRKPRSKSGGQSLRRPASGRIDSLRPAIGGAGSIVSAERCPRLASSTFEGFPATLGVRDLRHDLVSHLKYYNTALT